MKHLVLFATFLLLAVMMIACGGGNSGSSGGAAKPAPTKAAKEAPKEEKPVGDAKAGEALFKQPMLGTNPGCVTCHSLEPEVKLVGPSQYGIADRAGTRVAGKSAEEYIRESILKPNEFVVEGFTAGLMPQNFGETLKPEELNNIVAFMLTLKEKK